MPSGASSADVRVEPIHEPGGRYSPVTPGWECFEIVSLSLSFSQASSVAVDLEARRAQLCRMIQDRDFLLRQIHQLAVALLARLAGRTVEEEAPTVASAVGLDLAVAERLSVPTLLGLLTTADGLDAERTMLLGLAFAREAADVSGERAAVLRERALALVDAAVRARPALLTADVAAALGGVASFAKPG